MERTPPTLLLLALAVAAAGAAAPHFRANEDLYVGSACSTNKGAAGVCKSIRDCASAREALKRNEAPTICSYEDFIPIVCCTDAAPTPRPPTQQQQQPNAPSTGGQATTPAPRPGAPGAKAAKMCKQYAEAVWVWERSPTLSFPPQYTRKDSCAVKGVPFVVGGEEAVPNEFPHMALLGYTSRTRPEWKCGGSLISDRYVLTAAHCLTIDDGKPLVVRLGELNLKVEREPNNEHRDFGVAETIGHPQYTRAAHYYDVALLRLDTAVNFTRSYRPACLQAARALPREDAAVASGWGYLDWADNEISNTLMKVKLPLHPASVCSDSYRTAPRLRQGFDDASMVCAGDLKGGKDTCQGDSGGPLQIGLDSPYCMYSIVGITNFGKICGARKSPAVYARVSHYVPWIESIVWPDS